MYVNQIIKFCHEPTPPDPAPPDPAPVVEVPPIDPNQLDIDDEIKRILIDIQNNPR